MATSTDRTAKRATVYLQAGRMAATSTYYGSCCLVHAAQHGPQKVYDCNNLDRDRLTRQYINTMGFHSSLAYSEAMDSEYGFREKAKNGHRILALCFMAAMVEAGDA